jgi:DNA-binding NarL/FixJ family response regulator
MPTLWHMILRNLWLKIDSPMQTGAIWVIDSDIDDQDMVREVWRELELPNELIFLENARQTIERLSKAEVAPFIIICELNLPATDGFALREQILATNSKKFKSVPFIFWSTQASEAQITKAYDLSVHGFFIKENTFDEMKKTFIHIINYWLKSKMPSKTSKR